MAALPKYIPIEAAAERLDLPLAVLHEFVDSGKIDAVALPNGGIAVSEKSMSAPLRKEDLPEYKKHKHLAGIGISISDAARKHNIPTGTITRWMQHGYIKQIGKDGKRTLIDAQDIAYCAEIQQQREGQGKWLFNPDGTPYTPKSEQE